MSFTQLLQLQPTGLHNALALLCQCGQLDTADALSLQATLSTIALRYYRFLKLLISLS